jgi:hypothetical protein
VRVDMFRVKPLGHEDEVKNEWSYTTLHGVERESFTFFFYLCLKNSAIAVMPTLVTLKLI